MMDEEKDMDMDERPDQAAPSEGAVPSGFVPAGPAGSRDRADGEEGGRRKRAIAIAIALLALLLLAAGVFAWMTMAGRGDNLVADPNVRVGSITGNTADLDKIVDEGMLTFSINSTPVFEDGTAPGNLMIENSEINNNRFTVEITRDDTGEAVYKSGALDPGQYIDDVPLDVDLPAGEYLCTATFSTFRLADDTPIGQAAAAVTVKVEN